MSDGLAVKTPTDLISQAIASKVDVDQLEKLMGLQERWEEKEAKKAFFAAMNNFQENKPRIVKGNGVSHDQGKTNKFYFAPLAQIQKLVDPVLSKHGLSYSWKQDGKEGMIKITCIVKHIDGHSEESYIESEKDSSGGKNTIQAISSAVSYMKRITIMNSLGLASEDDDGASSQMSREEVEALALDKLIQLRNNKRSELDEKTANRLDEIIANEESTSYKKAIKTLESL